MVQSMGCDRRCEFAEADVGVLRGEVIAV